MGRNLVMKIKSQCQAWGCKIWSKNLRVYKGKMLCWNCYRKKVGLIWGTGGIGRNRRSLGQALDKIYYVRGHVDKRGYITASFSLPSIMAGHKIKVVLAD